MTRLQQLLVGLVIVLLLVLFWFLVYSPKQDEIAIIEEQIVVAQGEQERLRSELRSLREIRQEAPAAESALAASRALLPEEPGLPAALRQMQLAADESGVTLASVSATRPGIIDDELGLAAVGLSVEFSGTYFQGVDFLRRIEDPLITPRAMLWDTLLVAPEEYPELAMTISGNAFTSASGADLPPEVDSEGEEDTLDTDGDELEPGEEELLELENDGQEDAG